MNLCHSLLLRNNLPPANFDIRGRFVLKFEYFMLLWNAEIET